LQRTRLIVRPRGEMDFRAHAHTRALDDYMTGGRAGLTTTIAGNSKYGTENNEHRT
jgi:hypothetical protein